MAYSSENVRRVKELLARRRSQANDAAAQNRDHLHQISPEAVEIDQALGRTSMRLFAIACQPNGEDKDKQLAALRAENLSLQEARAALLQHLGLPKNYTEPQYVCHLCGDTGYTEQGMCACMKQALTYEGFRSSGIGYLIESQSFDNFSLGYYQGEDQDKMRQNLAIAKNYAQTFTLASGNLLLMGNTGLGKTHISTSIARLVIEKGYDVLYETAQNVIGAYEHDRFRSQRGDEPSSTKYETCELLIIDDLGTEFQTSFTTGCLYTLLSARLGHGRPTIINTNLTAQDLRSTYDDRITSRLLGHFRPLIFTGKDVRYQKL